MAAAQAEDFSSQHGAQDANVNFDMMALTGPDVELSDLVALLSPPPDARALAQRANSLRRAVEHLAAEYPGRFDVEGRLRRSVTELQQRVADLAPEAGEEAFARPDVARSKYGFTWADVSHYNTRNAVLVNLTHPEQSRLLRAPLAKAAGGLGLCESTTFASAKDPRYQAALNVIRGWAKELAEDPREDMPGAEPCAEYLVWWQKRLQSEAIEQRSRQALTRPLQ